MQPRHQPADLRTEDRCQRRGLRLNQYDVDTQPTQAGCHLTADETRADHNRVPRGRRVFAQREAFVERAQHPDAVQVGKRRNAPRHQAGRDHEFVIAQRRSVVESDRLGRGVQAGDRRSEPQRDVLLVVELARFERYVVDFAAQYLLGQWWAVIGQMDFVADDGQRAGIARPAQLLSGPGRSESSADDQYSVAA